MSSESLPMVRPVESAQVIIPPLDGSQEQPPPAPEQVQVLAACLNEGPEDDPAAALLATMAAAMVLKEIHKDTFADPQHAPPLDDKKKAI